MCVYHTYINIYVYNTFASTYTYTYVGPELFCFIFHLGILWGSAFLPIVLAVCSILELEAISTVFAIF